MKTLVAAAALAIAGVVTVQAADIAPVTGHWTKLGEHFSALVYYIDEPDGFHVVVTTQQGPGTKPRSRGSRRYWRRGRRPRFLFRVPRARRQRGLCLVMPGATCTLRSLQPPLLPDDPRTTSNRSEHGQRTAEANECALRIDQRTALEPGH
jgi:hypothetical protein